LDLTTTSSSSSSQQPGDDPFIPPEAYASKYTGGQPHDTPAGDVWACGVLLLLLLGGRLNPQVYSIGSSPKAARVRDTDLFNFPAAQQVKTQAAATSTTAQRTAQHSSTVNSDLKGLLTGMLQPCPSNRITLQGLQQHSWFVSGLPPAAGTMTQRFIDAGRKGRACRTSAQAVKALVLAAAAAGGAEALQVLLQQPRSAAATPAAQLRSRLQLLQRLQQKHQQQRDRPELPLLGLRGPVSAELLYSLWLQLHVLQQTTLQLHGLNAGATGNSSRELSASKLTEMLVAQQAAAYATACLSGMECAVRKLRQLQNLQQQKLVLQGSGGTSAGPGLQGLALQLQYACCTALFSTSKLQLLLRSTKVPYDWQQLHSSIPAADTKPDALGPGQSGRQQHLLKLQMYLLLQAHECLHSLWVCTATAAALADLCTPLGRRQEASALRALRACPAPHLLTAVLGPLPRALQQQLLLMSCAALGLQVGPSLLGHLVMGVLLLVSVNEAHSADVSGSFQQQQQRVRLLKLRAPVHSVTCVEDLIHVQVDKQPYADTSSSSSSSSGCVTYKGKVGQDKVLVVALSSQLPPDPTQPLPEARITAREVLLEKEKLCPTCPICYGLPKEAVFLFEDGRDYCNVCLTRHFEICAAKGKPRTAPLTNKEVKSDPTPNFGMRSMFNSDDTDKAKLLAAFLQKQQQQWQDSSLTVSARGHMGLAHAPQPKSTKAVSTFKQLVFNLQDAGLLSGVPGAASSSSSSSSSRTAAASSFPQQQYALAPLAPIHTVCSSPPLLVLPAPPAGTLQQWISSRASTLSSSSSAGDFTAAWVQDLPWPLLLQLLGDVAAGLSGLHQQQPAVVHGGVHAAAVHLVQQLPSTQQQQQQQQEEEQQTSDIPQLLRSSSLSSPEWQPPSTQLQQQQQEGRAGRVAQLSLVNLLAQLGTGSSCHPFLAAPESQLSSACATPATDVYGFGMLMYQIASGWLPQQCKPGTNDQVSAVLWSRKMLGQASSTSPLAAVQSLAQPQPPATPPQQQEPGSNTVTGRESGNTATTVTPLPVLLLGPGDWTPYGPHLLSSRALQGLPPGYVALMEQCLHSVAPARPCMQAVVARLQGIVQGTLGHAQQQQQQQQKSQMLEAMRVVKQRWAAVSSVI
jgi:serine/threonine protein kinase